MEASIKYRFSVGLLLTILAVVSTALTLHLHINSKVHINISQLLLDKVSEIFIKYSYRLFTTNTAFYGHVCTMKVCE